MAVTLRLQRRGQKKRPFYRIVAADQACRRDGRFLEIVGTYNPMTDPSTITIKEDRIRARVAEGAQTTRMVAKIIKNEIPGLLEEIETRQTTSKVARRTARKERNKGKEKVVSERKAKKKAKKAKGAGKKTEAAA